MTAAESLFQDHKIIAPRRAGKTTAQARELARISWDEATRVKDAYNSQVIKRRNIWRKAAGGPDSARARRNLKEAVDQLAAASERERDTWRAWHALGRPDE